MNFNQENSAAVLARDVKNAVGDFLNALGDCLKDASYRLDLSDKSTHGNQNSL